MVMHKRVHAVYIKVIKHYYSFWLNLTAKRETSCSSAWLHSILCRACQLPEVHLQSFGGGYSQRKNSCEASVSQPKLQHCGCVFVPAARHRAANFQPSFVVFMAANSSGGKLDVFSMNSRSKLVGFRSQTPLDALSFGILVLFYLSVFVCNWKCYQRLSSSDFGENGLYLKLTFSKTLFSFSCYLFLSFPYST